MIIIWTLKPVPVEFGRLEEVIQWGHPRQLRGHVGDVIDLCWTKDSSHLVSGSMDGTAILWSISGNKFNKIQTFDGHKKYVQGVSIDPLMKFIVSMSADCTIRVYKNRKLKQTLQFFHKYVSQFSIIIFFRHLKTEKRNFKVMVSRYNKKMLK